MTKRTEEEKTRFLTEMADCWVSDLKVLSSPAGFYVGRDCLSKNHAGLVESYSRESFYFPTAGAAEVALHSMGQTFRAAPESDLPHESFACRKIAS